jgi:uncharacterized protein YpiB (UPF0302 family)
MPVEIKNEFVDKKGNTHETISIWKEGNEKWPFSFGKEKAKLIVANYDAIKAFAESEEKKA